MKVNKEYLWLGTLKCIKVEDYESKYDIETHLLSLEGGRLFAYVQRKYLPQGQEKHQVLRSVTEGDSHTAPAQPPPEMHQP